MLPLGGRLTLGDAEPDRSIRPAAERASPSPPLVSPSACRCSRSAAALRPSGEPAAASQRSRSMKPSAARREMSARAATSSACWAAS